MALNSEPKTMLTWQELATSVRWPMIPPQAYLTAAPGITLTAVTSTDTQSMAHLRAMFEELFPDYPQYRDALNLSCEPFSRSHPRTIEHVWLVKHDDQPIGLRIFSYILGHNFGHGGFIGLIPAKQGQGIGRWLISMTQAQLALDAFYLGSEPPAGYTAEVEPLEGSHHATSRDLLLARTSFHQRCGARRFDVTYFEPLIMPGDAQPSISNQTIQPMNLIFYAREAGYTPSLEQLEAMIKAIYRDVYQLPPDSPLEQQALASLDGKVRYAQF